MSVDPMARCAKDPTAMKLTPKQKRFVEEYLVDLNGAQAAIRAGYSARTAKQFASELMGKPAIQTAISEAMSARAERTEITQDAVLQRLWQIATADPRKLVEYRRGACRHCHGKGHAYQWRTKAEFAAALTKPSKGHNSEPDDSGGYGYDANAAPHPACPYCNGDGIGRHFIHDTRKLSGPALLLYAGVKETRDGLEVKQLDQMRALENVARHLGMFKDKVEFTGKDGGPVRIASDGPDLSKLSLDELRALDAMLAKCGANDDSSDPRPNPA